jgi:hypothetical protein
VPGSVSDGAFGGGLWGFAVHKGSPGPCPVWERSIGWVCDLCREKLHRNFLKIAAAEEQLLQNGKAVVQILRGSFFV